VKNKAKMNEQTIKLTEQKVTSKYPRASDFVKSPLRNRLILELNKTISEVFALVGDPGNMPKYSEGLERVETKMVNGKCSSCTCYFKPLAKGEDGAVHEELVVWQEANLGWASIAEGDDQYGFSDYFSLTTLEAKNGKTLLTWHMHFNHENEEMLEMNTSTLVGVFEDMAERLIAKFNGRVIENYMEPIKKQ